MLQIRTVTKEDNASLAEVIRVVSAEHGLTSEAGYAVGDSTLDHMYDVYTKPNTSYWVVINENGDVCGGGGVAPLKGTDDMLEIQKMYLLPHARGKGMAKAILDLCFQFGKKNNFNKFYLETTGNLEAAITLYEKLGFTRISHALGNTGHSHACEVYMLKIVD